MSLFRFVQWVAERRPVVIFGYGKQSRDFTYIDDIARGTLAGLRPLGYEVINLGSEHPVVLDDVLAHIEELLDTAAAIEYRPLHKADVLATSASTDKARYLPNGNRRRSGAAASSHWCSGTKQIAAGRAA